MINIIKLIERNEEIKLKKALVFRKGFLMKDFVAPTNCIVLINCLFE